MNGSIVPCGNRGSGLIPGRGNITMGPLKYGEHPLPCDEELRSRIKGR
nr:MAG TPA: hypothetical protein [Bacteriophage sp.]